MASNKISILAKKMTALVSKPDKIIFSVLERHVDDLESLQADQMQKGLNAEGKEIGVLRNPTYAVKKKSKGGRAPLGIVDLKDTGAFQRGIKAQIVHKAIHIESTDQKNAALIEKYGEEIYGFNQDTKQLAKPLLLPTAKFEVLRALQI